MEALPEPQPFVRRSRQLPELNASDSASTQDLQRGAGSRAHYNRLVGSIVQDEFFEAIDSDWSEQAVDWVLDVFDAYELYDNRFIRAQCLQDDLLECDHPTFDLLDIPDQNES